MNDVDELFTQLKRLCIAVTEKMYSDYDKQGYAILVKIHDVGITQNRVYNTLLQYHNDLPDGLSKDWLADMLDYICGWTAPQWHIWRSDGAFKRTK